MSTLTQITETKVLWDKPGNRLFVWDHDTNSWARFVAATGVATGEQLAAGLDGKLDKEGGEIAGSLAIGDTLSVSGAATFAGGLTAASLTMAGAVSAALGAFSGNVSVGGTMTAADAEIGGSPIAGDGDDIFVDGRRVAIVGEGHYRFKTITRLFSGTSVAIASDTRAALIRGVGGGGGGGGAEGGASGAAAGGGGAGGAYFEAFKTDVAGQTLSYAIGAGGSAGSTSGGTGGTGGTTSIANGAAWTLTAAGGTGGEGQDNDTFAQARSGGFGQNASGGDLNVGGEAGTGAIRLNDQNNLPGKGGSSRFGAGGQAFAGNAAGQQGLGHGAGGGGGAVASNATGRAGGAGTDGYIEIWELT